MRQCVRLVLCFALVCAVEVAADSIGFAQTPDAANAQPAPPPAAGAPGVEVQKAEFEKLFAERQQLVEEYGRIKEGYGSASAEQKQAMTGRARQIVERLAAVHPQVVGLAEQIYAASPEADPRAALVLKASCEGLFVADDYEPSLRLAKLLVDRGAKEKNLYLLGGIAALYVGDLETAKQYLAAAVQQGANLDSGLEGLDPTIVAFHKDSRSYEEAWRKEQEIRAREAQANDLPRVLLKTNRGDVEIELFENEAPNTVANFITLVDKGYYNGLSFHRVLPGFMAQGGCPKGDGSGGPGYDIACECHQPNYRKHFRGSLSMAHAGRDTGGSQFFLTFIPTKSLDGVHTVFGRVVKGMDVLAKIRRRDPDDPAAASIQPDRIVEAKVLRKRPHEYVVRKR